MRAHLRGPSAASGPARIEANWMAQGRVYLAARETITMPFRLRTLQPPEMAGDGATGRYGWIGCVGAGCGIRGERTACIVLFVLFLLR